MPSSRRPRRYRRGTTLIEVLAGLVVLGTLLVSIAIARARFVHQSADADRRLRATRAADAMLATWFAGPTPAVPIRATGALDGEPDFAWRTRIIASPPAANLGAVVVRLEVTDRSMLNAAAPVVTVDLLVHRMP
jgi:type II secretory pathway pseudopilin PulG